MWNNLTDAQVALIIGIATTLTAIIVGWWQYGKKAREKENAEHKANTAAKQVEVVSAASSASETAMASLAEKSLQLVQNLLETEKVENQKLRELVTNLETDKRELLIIVEKKDRQIADLEKELERLRGRLDAIVHTLNDQKGTGKIDLKDLT